MKVTKKKLAEKISTELIINNNESKLLVNSIVSFLIKNIQSKTLKLSGFGTFKIIKTKQRVGRNPRTLEEFTIPSQRKIRFQASKIAREKIN